MADSYIQVAPDGSGKKMQTYENIVSGQDVHAEAVVLVDKNGIPIVLGGSIGNTTNLLKGDGAGAAVDSGIAPANVVQKQLAYATPTTLNQVIACLQAAGLCS